MQNMVYYFLQFIIGENLMSPIKSLLSVIGLFTVAILNAPVNAQTAPINNNTLIQNVTGVTHLGTYELSSSGQLTPTPSNPNVPTAAGDVLWDNTGNVGQFRNTIGQEVLDTGDLPDGTIIGEFQVGFATDATGSVSFRYTFYENNGFNTVGNILPTNSGGQASYDFTVGGLPGGGIGAFTFNVVLPVDDHFIITGADIDANPGTDWGWGFIATDIGTGTAVGPLISAEGAPPGAPGRGDFFDLYTPDVATGTHSGAFFFGGAPFAQYHMLLLEGLPYEADLSITNTDGVTSAIPGNSLTYTIVASNAGPADDPTVTVADTFPTGLTCNYTSVAAGGATGNTAAGSGNLAESLSLPSGSSVTYTAICDIASNATGTLSNTATISGTVPDPQAANNTVTDDDTVLSVQADLSIAMTSPPANVTTPGTFTYTIDVSNAGPSDATNVIVTDTLNVGFFSAETNGCAEDPNGYPDCTLGAIAAGDTASYSISFTLGSVDGEITNTVSVTSDATDSVVANNSASSASSGGIRIIPTINQWGLIVLFLLILSFSYHYIFRKKTV
jgi:uncharacterized repeat protein (TIGR01451 family)